MCWNLLYSLIILEMFQFEQISCSDVISLDLDHFGDHQQSSAPTGLLYSTPSVFDYHHGGHSLFQTIGSSTAKSANIVRYKFKKVEPSVGAPFSSSEEYNRRRHCRQHKNDRNDGDVNNEVLESEFGVFEDQVGGSRQRHSRLQTPKPETVIRNSTKWVPLTNIQKVTKPSPAINSSDSSSKINRILKNYLAKLYMRKYQQKKLTDPNMDLTEDQQSKFLLGGSYGLAKNKTGLWKKKMFSLFTVVQFENTECSAISDQGSTYVGVCYTQEGCDALWGMSLGNCAEGYGVCCVFRFTCGQSSNQNCTYFENPGYPNYDPPGSGGVIPPNGGTVPPVTPNPGPTPDPRFPYYNPPTSSGEEIARIAVPGSFSCQLSVYKVSEDVQQMRIDFIDLELTGPTDGNCTIERLIISGQNMNDPIPAICGYNTGSHVYVDVSTLTGPLQISVLSSNGQPKRFKLRICQIATPCASSSNCLQYYTGVAGTISSFNYDQAAAINRSSPSYFNNLNYAICIRKESGYCSITYSNVMAGLEYQFQLVNFADNGVRTVPLNQAGAGIIDCPDDYVAIAGVRLCGDKFNDGSIVEDFRLNAPVTDSSAGPIVVQVRSDATRTGRGFKLFYMQNRCT